MAGTLAEVSAECILILREIYKENLKNLAEPEVAAGVLRHMLVYAADIKFDDDKDTDKEIIFSK